MAQVKRRPVVDLIVAVKVHLKFRIRRNAQTTELEIEYVRIVLHVHGAVLIPVDQFHLRIV